MYQARRESVPSQERKCTKPEEKVYQARRESVMSKEREGQREVGGGGGGHVHCVSGESVLLCFYDFSILYFQLFW